MNETIKAIWNKAASSHEQADTSWQTQQNFLNRFAELIVKECASQCLSDDCMRILNHFGLERSDGWVCPDCGTDRTKSVCPRGHMAAITGHCPMTLEAQ